MREVSTIDISSFKAYHHIGALVLVADRSGNILFANQAVKTLLGYEPDEVLGQEWYALTDSNNVHINQRREVVGKMATGNYDLKNRDLHESCLKTKDGRKVWTQWTNKLIDEELVVGIGQDITEKRKLKERLLEKNKENELILKEIHHRVKNNLQIISSLLNLQFEGCNGQRIQKALHKSKARISAMALVHNMLFKTKDLSAIDFKAYMNLLTDSIQVSSCGKDRIEIHLDLCEAAFDIDTTINLGMIVTELISNILEHAYETEKEKTAYISLTKNTNGEHRLLVKDNGKGFEKINNNEESSLGYQLVESLCDQINASFEVTTNKGTTVALRF